MYKTYTKYLVNSHIWALKFVLLTGHKKMFFLPKNLCVNIECPDVHANIYLFDILKNVFKQWVHMHLGSELNFRFKN
jgi:hypothetical protein